MGGGGVRITQRIMSGNSACDLCNQNNDNYQGETTDTIMMLMVKTLARAAKFANFIINYLLAPPLNTNEYKNNSSLFIADTLIGKYCPLARNGLGTSLLS